MVSKILLIGSLFGVIISYFLVLVKYAIYKKKYLDGYSGFDGAKEVTLNYDEINIVNSSDVIFSEYDAKRNVIRLNNKNYDGNSYFDIVVSTILAGYSLVNSSNSNYFKFKSIIRKINYLGFGSLIGLVLFVLFLIYQYMRYMIAVSGNEITKNNLDKKIFSLIESILNSSVTFYKLSFIVSLIMIGRLIVIIIGM